MFLDVNRNGNLCFLISLIKNLPSVQEIQVQSLGQEDPLEEYYCLWNSMDRGAWWVTVHRLTKSWTQLSKTLAPLFSVLCCHTNPKAFPNEPPPPWSVCGLCSQQQLVFTSVKPLLMRPHSHLPLVLSPSPPPEREPLEDKDWCLSLHHQGSASHSACSMRMFAS